MTTIAVATIDVYVLRRAGDAWETLLLQRAENTRCTGAWEVVHGNLEKDERPEDGALRELREETALEAERLYSIIVQPFYLHKLAGGTVTLAVVFAAIVPRDKTVVLGEEHQAAEWMSIDSAKTRVAWPRSCDAFTHIELLLAGGDAGPVEDMLRVR